MRFLIWSAVVAAASVGFVSPGNAQATATRTWVSGVGDDVNPCTRTAPCKTFAGALGKTAAGGEINVLDPGDYGPVAINKAITIRADHVEAGIQIPSGAAGAINVSAGSGDTVVLEGLDLDGHNASSAYPIGVAVSSGGLVYILRCSIRNFYDGIAAVSTSPSTRIFVRDSFILRNVTGVTAGGLGASGTIALSNTLVDGNQSQALVTNQTSAALANSILSGSPAGIANSGGTINSFGPSNIITGSGAPTASTPFK